MVLGFFASRCAYISACTNHAYTIVCSNNLSLLDVWTQIPVQKHVNIIGSKLSNAFNKISPKQITQSDPNQYNVVCFRFIIFVLFYSDLVDVHLFIPKLMDIVSDMLSNEKIKLKVSHSDESQLTSHNTLHIVQWLIRINTIR